METKHTPVMLEEVLSYLNPKAGENFIDCTLGGGGYTFALAERIKPGGTIIGIDLDEQAIECANKKIKKNKYKNIILVHDNFKKLTSIAREYTEVHKAAGFNGIVFDLGLSSDQLKDRSRGFSFQVDAPLRMEYGTSLKESGLTTEKIVNNYRASNLERIIKEYSEERYAKRIAREIVKARTKKPITHTLELVNTIKRAVPAPYRRAKIHYATRTFQALRIATNNELINIQEALLAAANNLVRGGRLVVVSYHSLEDRLVKQFFKHASIDCICPPELPECRCEHKASLKIITKKVITASTEELNNNPRSRSAKLRVAEKL